MHAVNNSLIQSFILFLQLDKHIPLHVRKKMKGHKPKPRTFEIMPPSGCLLPGQRINVQIKFMPTEEVSVVVIQNRSDTSYDLIQCVLKFFETCSAGLVFSSFNYTALESQFDI